MRPADDILVLGGYGVVGRRIAAQLSALHPGRVVIAGHDGRAAASAAAAVGRGCRARAADARERAPVRDALDGVRLAINCVDAPEKHLLLECAERGLAYADVTPALAFHGWDERLDAEARRTGARLLLGAGLAPGISSVLAAALDGRVGPLRRIDACVLLGIGDDYGPASFRGVLEEAIRPYTVVRDGAPQAAHAFSERRRVRFAAPLGGRIAYAFPFSDAALYPRTLGVRTSLGWLALDPPWLGRTAAALVRLGASEWLFGSRSVDRNRRALAALQRAYPRRDRFGLTVSGAGERGETALRLAGRGQADATAAGAAELGRMLYEGRIDRAGAYMPEQVVAPEPFLERLARHGLVSEERGRERGSVPLR